MRPSGKRHSTIPIPFGGQFSAGDPTTQPDGTVRLLRNYMIRSNRWDGRAPFVFDSHQISAAVNGFAVWQDTVNYVSVACAFGSNALYQKNSSGADYASGIAGLTGHRLISYTNFLGKLYMMFDNGSGLPDAAAMFYGTANTQSPFNVSIVSRTITAFNDRLFFGGGRVTVSPKFISVLTELYNFGAQWIKNNVTVNTITQGSTVVRRLLPTATSYTNFATNVTWATIAASIYTSPATILATDTVRKVVYRGDFRGVDASYDMPIELQVCILTSWQNAHVYVAGDIVYDGRTDPGGLWTVTTGGTSSGANPFPVGTVGATQVDNTVTWTKIGSNVIGATPTVVPSITSSNVFKTVFVTAAVPLATNTQQISPRLVFGNAANPTFTLVAIDGSLMDGQADGATVKHNFGQQITVGDFYFPFINTETATTAAINIDALIWSEIENAEQILAKNTYPLIEIPGLPTAACVVSGRYVVFKRKGMWIFKGVADINEPILPETPAIAVGCLGPLALAVSTDDEMFWIGENHVYRMKIGDSGPTAIDSPGMFEEIMNRTSTSWVESQSTYNMPLLAIDDTNKDVWIYTQKGKIHVYSLQSQMWSYLDTNPTGTSTEVACMIFDPTSRRMLVSFAAQGATRFDETSDAGDTIVAGGGTTWNIQNDIVPKPIELFAPRYEASLLELGLFHNATIQQGTITLSYSFDRGATYTTPPGYPVSTYLTNPRIRLPLAATGESVTVKISRTGAGGARNWSISKMDALLRVHRGELTKVNAA